jgi:uncharacterized small protein (DUF1192 family)
MEFKTKVIAVRVTQTEYDAVKFVAQRDKLKAGVMAYNALSVDFIADCLGVYRKEQKRLEAKAKRDAKKAAANGVQ